MDYSSSRQELHVSEVESPQLFHSSNRRLKLFLIIAVSVAFGIGIGILIGYVGIKKESVSSSDTNQDGVFLPGVADKIIKDADPEISDIIINGINSNNIRTYLRVEVDILDTIVLSVSGHWQDMHSNRGSLFRRNLSLTPHIAGTPEDYTQAHMLQEFWKEVGLDDAVLTSYDILLSYPNANVPSKLSMHDENGNVVLESPDRDAILTEYENQTVPFPYHAYSGNGTVKGPMVYVNYARAEDFQILEKKDINVSGCIVIARHGKIGRSSKVANAQARGAIGVVLYTDPADYIASGHTDVYPDTWWIPPTATQMGSIFRGTGDPLTPGYPASKSAYRYNESEVDLPRIPVIPVSYGTIQHFIGNLSGEVASKEWTGALNIIYRIGTGFRNSTWNATLQVETYNVIKTTFNAFGIIHGSVEPDRYVLLGNHRDSWVFGAIDPSSGTAVMMEISRLMASLTRTGRWRPRRTIIFCSWGSEEFALIGSTEWIEETIKQLDRRAVAYINLDIAVTGNYSVRSLGTPPLHRAMHSTARKVPNPDPTEIAAGRRTVYDTWLMRRPWTNSNTNETYDKPWIPIVGAGSDYATFQMYAGIPCADFRYDYDLIGNNLAFYPLYHTGYETFYAVDKLVDPGFVLHATVGKLSGELLRSLADSMILPFNITEYSVVLQLYTDNLWHGYEKEISNSGIDIGHLREAVRFFYNESVTFHQYVSVLNRNDPIAVRRVNDQLMEIERVFLEPQGLPGQRLIRHLTQSTTMYSSVAGPSFPGLIDTLTVYKNNMTDIKSLQNLKLHYSVVVHAVQSAAYSIRDVTRFIRRV